MKALTYTLAFIGGAAAGAIAGLLLAPEKGSDLRCRVAEKSSDLRDRIAEACKKRGIRLSKDNMTELVDEIAEEFEPKEAE